MRRIADASLINQMLAIDLRFILADGDLPKVTRMCELAGVDVGFPLLDERVVVILRRACRPDLKLRGTQLRWFFKQALRDFLPPEIISKKKHGFGLPVGAWLIDAQPLFDLAARRHRPAAAGAASCSRASSTSCIEPSCASIRATSARWSGC